MNDQLHEKVFGIEKQVSLLERDSEMQLKIFNKLEKTVEKIHDLTESMHRLISLHDEKLRQHEITSDQLERLIQERKLEYLNDIKEIHTRIDNETRTLSAKIEKTQETILNEIKDLKEKWQERENKILNIELNKETKPEQNSLGKIVEFVNTWKWAFIFGAFIFGMISGHKLDLK